MIYFEFFLFIFLTTWLKLNEPGYADLCTRDGQYLPARLSFQTIQFRSKVPHEIPWTKYIEYNGKYPRVPNMSYIMIYHTSWSKYTIFPKKNWRTSHLSVGPLVPPFFWWRLTWVSNPDGSPFLHVSSPVYDGFLLFPFKCNPCQPLDSRSLLPTYFWKHNLFLSGESSNGTSFCYLEASSSKLTIRTPTYSFGKYIYITSVY